MTSFERPVVAIVGATGLVGRELMSELEPSSLAYGELHLFGSKDSVGELYSFRGDEIEVEELTDAAFESIDIVVWAAPHAIPAGVIAHIKKRKGKILDLTGTVENSGAETASDKANVPEKSGVAADSTVFSIQPTVSAVVIASLTHAARLCTPSVISLVALEGVAGAGKKGLDELWEQGIAIYNQGSIEADCFPEQIAFNCLPYTGVLLEDGRTREEKRIERAIERMLPTASTSVSASLLRVPVFHGLGVQVVLTPWDKSYTAPFIAALSDDRTLVVNGIDDAPSLLSVVGDEKIHIGRIRGTSNTLSFWVAADGIKVGAVVPILQELEVALGPAQ